MDKESRAAFEKIGDDLKRICDLSDERIANFALPKVDRAMVTQKQERDSVRYRSSVLAKTAMALARLLPQDRRSKALLIDDITIAARTIRALAPPPVPGFEPKDDAANDAAFETVIEEAFCWSRLRS